MVSGQLKIKKNLRVRGYETKYAGLFFKYVYNIKKIHILFYELPLTIQKNLFFIFTCTEATWRPGALEPGGLSKKS